MDHFDQTASSVVAALPRNLRVEVSCLAIQIFRWVTSVFCFFQTSAFSVYAAIDLYKTDLECLAYCRLPRYHMPEKFHDRGDGPFLHLLKECPYIHTLVSLAVYGLGLRLKLGEIMAALGAGFDSRDH